MRVRKKCLACGRTSLYERDATACSRRYGYGNLGHRCGGPLELVRRKAPQRRERSVQESAAREAATCDRMVRALAEEIRRKAQRLAEWQRAGEKARARAAMTDAQVAEERERRKAAAAKALETRARKARRGLELAR